MLQERIQQVKAKVQECIVNAESKYNIVMPKIEIRFDLTGKVAGSAGWKSVGGVRSYFLRFNTQMIQSLTDWDHMINDTVPHEVAHSVCQANPKLGRNHDRGWKSVCLALGGNGKRCWDANDAPEAAARSAKTRPYVYVSTTGATINVGKIVHNRIQRGTTYSARDGGQLNKFCNFSTAR